MSVYSHQSSPILVDETMYPYRVIGYDHYYPVSVGDENGEARYQFPGEQSSPIPFLAYPAGIFLGKVVLALLQNTSQAVHLKRVFENPMANGLKSMILQGFGVAWLPESIIGDELISGKLVKIGDDSLVTKLEIRLYRGNLGNKQQCKSLWQKVIDVT
jgi:DNA-binding transcriptional LysR family regulator